MSEKTIQERIAEELLKERKDPEDKGVSAIRQGPVVKKEAKVKESPPIKAKSYYDVKVEAMLPATLTYRVLAESPEQAADLIRGTNPIHVKHRLVGKKDIKLSVYDAGSSMLRWAKNLIGM